MYGEINPNRTEKKCDLNTACCCILTRYFCGNFDLHKAMLPYEAPNTNTYQ